MCAKTQGPVGHKLIGVSGHADDQHMQAATSLVVHLYLGGATLSRRDAIQAEGAQTFVVTGKLPLTLHATFAVSGSGSVLCRAQPYFASCIMNGSKSDRPCTVTLKTPQCEVA